MTLTRNAPMAAANVGNASGVLDSTSLQAGFTYATLLLISAAKSSGLSAVT